MAEPLITAAIPVRDGEAYLAEAIESVLGQSRPCDQVIVVDNGSSDRSAEIAVGFGSAVEVVPEPRPGIGPARNAALRAARGDYLAFLDADDLWEADKTAVQLAAFEAEPRLQLVFGHVRQFVSSDLASEEAEGLRVPPAPQPGQHIGAMLARRAAIEAIGPWPEDVRVSDGLTFLLRARELGLAQAMLAETVTLRRVHGANHSIHNRNERSEFARHLKRSLDRRRGAAS
ncbi:MAG TPA: glycosyltransferase family A protein [Solirubrobacterales bacterium]|nr:glycosyltransferase family A protein [Solirubrobacterales bacterium]